MASSDRSGVSGKSSEEHLVPVTSRTLLFPKATGSKIELGYSVQAKEAFERWQRSLNLYDTNVSFVHHVLDLLEAEQAPRQQQVYRVI